MENFLFDFMLGGGIAAVSKIASAPFDRSKIVMQTQGSNPDILASGNLYTGFGDCITRFVMEEGVASLWKGNLASVIRYFPTQAMNFAFKDVYRHVFATKPTDSQAKKFFANILSGGAAGATSLLLVYPLDLANTLLSADVGKVPKFSGIFDCLG